MCACWLVHTNKVSSHEQNQCKDCNHTLQLLRGGIDQVLASQQHIDFCCARYSCCLLPQQVCALQQWLQRITYSSMILRLHALAAGKITTRDGQLPLTFELASQHQKRQSCMHGVLSPDACCKVFGLQNCWAVVFPRVVHMGTACAAQSCNTIVTSCQHLLWAVASRCLRLQRRASWLWSSRQGRAAQPCP